MYNSHKDPLFSLALNIIDGCTQTRRIYQKKEGIGQDIDKESAVDMFRCAYQLANQLKHDNIAGLFFELSPILFLKQDDLAFGASSSFYYDPIRRLHLLPQYVKDRITAGSWPLPFGNKAEDSMKKIQYMAGKMREDFYYVVRDPLMLPLSFVPDIDMHWLCPEPEHREDRVVDVFGWLSDSIMDIVTGALEAEEKFPFPTNARTPDRWLKSQVTLGNYNWHVPGLLYLLYFFPYKVSELVADRPSVNVKFIYDALGANLPTGDSVEFMQYLFLPLLKYGPFSLRMWIEEVQKNKEKETKGDK